MEQSESNCGCQCNACGRRQFLGQTVAAAGTLSLGMTAGWVRAEGKKDAMKVRLVFALHAEVQPGADWPNVGYDFRPEMKEMAAALNAGVEGVEFIPTLAVGPDDAKKIAEEDTADGNIAGYLVVQMNCWNQVMQTLLKTGKPVLYSDFPYGGSGGFLVYTSAAIRSAAPNFAFVSSLDFADTVAAAQAFCLVKGGAEIEKFSAAVKDFRVQRVPKADLAVNMSDAPKCLSTDDLMTTLKGKKILAVGAPMGRVTEAAQESLGIEIVELDFAPLNAYWEKADRAEAAKIVAHWKTTADDILDVNDETLLDSARMFLAQKSLMAEHNAEGITVNCLGGFYGGHIHAYPCLGFGELLNLGLIGGCECDIRSAITMLVLSQLTGGRTGFISDPVMDLSTKTIIYAHCVAPYKAFGPNGPVNPYTIMTHSEDRQGASLRSILPPGNRITTTIEIGVEKKQILFHQALAVGNSLSDLACRTKLVGHVLGDFEKLYTEWDAWGWHRVTVYGDLKKPIYELAAKIGFEVVEEA